MLAVPKRISETSGPRQPRGADVSSFRHFPQRIAVRGGEPSMRSQRARRRLPEHFAIFLDRPERDSLGLRSHYANPASFLHESWRSLAHARRLFVAWGRALLRHCLKRRHVQLTGFFCRARWRAESIIERVEPLRPTHSLFANACFCSRAYASDGAERHADRRFRADERVGGAHCCLTRFPCSCPFDRVTCRDGPNRLAERRTELACSSPPAPPPLCLSAPSLSLGTVP